MPSKWAHRGDREDKDARCVRCFKFQEALDAFQRQLEPLRTYPYPVFRLFPALEPVFPQLPCIDASEDRTCGNGLESPSTWHTSSKGSAPQRSGLRSCLSSSLRGPLQGENALATQIRTDLDMSGASVGGKSKVNAQAGRLHCSKLISQRVDSQRGVSLNPSICAA